MKAAQLFDVSGRVAVVTGAASGLGLAITETLAENGATVLMIDVDAGGLEAARSRLSAARLEVEAEALDVSNAALLRAAFDGAARRHGRIDVAFANAGISGGPSYRAEGGQLENVPPQTWQRVLDVNLTGVFTTLQCAAAHMKRQRGGRIVVTASIAGLKGDPMVGYPYAASKAAVINLVRQAALELAPYNVLVNAIAPGPFMTHIAGGRLQREPEVVKAFEASVPLGRLAQPQEIQGLALLLASGASSYITGAVIPVDGGASAG